MKTKYLIILFALIGLVSCEKEIDMKINETPKKLVINAWFQPDSFFKVNVGLNKHILEKDFLNLTNANVFVYENGILIDSLVKSGKNSYSGYGTLDFCSLSKKPIAGNFYKIEAVSPDYGTTTSESFIPDTVPINFITVDTSIINYRGTPYFYQDVNGDTIFYQHMSIKINLSFSDAKNVENFYLLYLEQLPNPKDSFYFYPYKYSFQYTSPAVEMTSNGSLLSGFNKVDDESVLNGNNQQNNYASVLLFSDALFDGKNYNIQLSSYSSFTYKGNKVIEPITNSYAFYLVSISKDYYQYIKSVSIYSGNNDPFTEPVQVYMNVKNGFGIFLTSFANKRIINL